MIGYNNIDCYVETTNFDYSNSIDVTNYLELDYSFDAPNYYQKPEYSFDTPNYKGYSWEMKGRIEFLNIPYLSQENYQGNPVDYSNWQNEHNKNPFDAAITLPNGKVIKIEYKFNAIGTKVFHSWFERDWLPRDADIYVTSNPQAVSYRDKREIERKGKKILSLPEACAYIRQLIDKILHPNKYLYLNKVLLSSLCLGLLLLTRFVRKAPGLLSKTILNLLVLGLNSINLPRLLGCFDIEKGNRMNKQEVNSFQTEIGQKVMPYELKRSRISHLLRAVKDSILSITSITIEFLAKRKILYGF